MSSNAYDQPPGGRRRSGDWLDALTVMGRILILTPVALSLFALLYAVVVGENLVGTLGSDAGGSAYAVGLIFLCGVIALTYAAIKRFRQGLRGERE